MFRACIALCETPRYNEQAAPPGGLFVNHPWLPQSPPCKTGKAAPCTAPGTSEVAVLWSTTFK